MGENPTQHDVFHTHAHTHTRTRTRTRTYTQPHTWRLGVEARGEGRKAGRALPRRQHVGPRRELHPAQQWRHAPWRHEGCTQPELGVKAWRLQPYMAASSQQQPQWHSSLTLQPTKSPLSKPDSQQARPRTGGGHARGRHPRRAAGRHPHIGRHAAQGPAQHAVRPRHLHLRAAGQPSAGWRLRVPVLGHPLATQPVCTTAGA